MSVERVERTGKAAEAGDEGYIRERAQTEPTAEQTTANPTSNTPVNPTTHLAGATTMVAPATVAASVRRYPIAPGYSVNVRSGPGVGYRIVRVLPEGSYVSIHCQQPGETVTGPYGTTKIWDSIADGQYVSDAYVRTGSGGYVAPRCS